MQFIKMIHFLVHWSNICTFQTIRERSRFSCFIYTYCEMKKQKKLLQKNFLKKVWISPEGFLMSRSSMILFMVSLDTWWIENSLLILNFFFIAFILWWKTNFLIIGLCHSLMTLNYLWASWSEMFTEN